MHIYDVSSHSFIFPRIPPWGWPRGAETCRRITICMYIIVSNSSAVVGIYMVTFLNTRNMDNFKLFLCHSLKTWGSGRYTFSVQDGGGRYLNAPPALLQGDGPQHPLNRVSMGHRAYLEVIWRGKIMLLPRNAAFRSSNLVDKYNCTFKCVQDKCFNFQR